MSQQLHMDVPRMEKVARGFHDLSGLVKKIDGQIDFQIELLKKVAFLGRVGTAAVVRYLEGLQPKVQRLSELLGVYGERLDNEIQQWKNMQQSG